MPLIYLQYNFIPEFLFSFFLCFLLFSSMFAITTGSWREKESSGGSRIPRLPIRSAEPLHWLDNTVPISPFPSNTSPYSSLRPRLLCSVDLCPWQSHPGILSPAQAHSWPCLPSPCICVCCGGGCSPPAHFKLSLFLSPSQSGTL